MTFLKRPLFLMSLVTVALGNGLLLAKEQGKLPIQVSRQGQTYIQQLKLYKPSQEQWYDWQIRWENVNISRHGSSFSCRFRGFQTLYKFFHYFFPRATVPLTEERTTFWDIPLLDIVPHVADCLGIDRKTLQGPMSMNVATLYPLDESFNMIWVHIHTPFFVDAIFQEDKDGWYNLVFSEKDNANHPRGWKLQFYLLEGRTGRYIVIPNWQMGTGSGYHAENLRVYSLHETQIRRIVDEQVFEAANFYSWSTLTSTLSWNASKEMLIVVKEEIRGRLEHTSGSRKVIQVVFDLKRPGSRTEKTLRKEQIQTSPDCQECQPLDSPEYQIRIEGVE
ncbi:MAG: hypothetical protein ACE5KO_05510 [Candidatus Bathyarchaeia archaeon]